MPHEFILRRRVEFSETDMAGIVHYAQFFRYMEAVEHAFFRSLGLSIVTRIGERRYGWPRVHAECDYKAPLYFEEEFDGRLRVRQVRSRSLVLDFLFTKPGPDGDAIEVARGSLATVCVTYGEDGTMHPTAIPPELAEKL